MKIVTNNFENKLNRNRDKRMMICNGINEGDNPCCSVLEILPEDIIIRSGSDINDKFYSFVCPVCGVITNVNINTYSSETIEFIEENNRLKRMEYNIKMMLSWPDWKFCSISKSERERLLKL